jgi:hypothetical protein
MSDEARHVAFGVLSLKSTTSSSRTPNPRAPVRLRSRRPHGDRFLQQETWERLGVDVKEAVKDDAPRRPIFQAMLFSKIVPNCKKLGLLDAGDGWLRELHGLGVIQFEDWVDPARNTCCSTK